MTTRLPHPFVRELLGDNELVAVDVGARYDIPGGWRVLEGKTRVIAFEPDPKACAELRSVYDARGFGHLYRNLPIALSAKGGPRTLYVTNTPSGSSLLNPDTPLNRAYTSLDYIFPINERVIDTRTLGSVLDEVGEAQVQLIKIDVEGAALEVLEGLDEARLARVMSVEIETAIAQQFQGERTLFDIHAFMTARGFLLHDVNRLYGRPTRQGKAGGYEREVFGVHSGTPTISARLCDVDALYFRDPDDVLRHGSGEVLKMAAVFCTYGYFSEAYKLIERSEAAGVLTASVTRQAQEAIVAWHRLPRFRTIFHRPTPFWSLLRQATKMVGMTDQVVDQLTRGNAREVLKRVLARARDAFPRAASER
jgi:FkbM family methyltransferase